MTNQNSLDTFRLAMSLDDPAKVSGGKAQWSGASSQKYDVEKIEKRLQNLTLLDQKTNGAKMQMN